MPSHEVTWVIQFFLKLQYSVLERDKLCRGLAVWDGKRCVEWKEGREEEGIKFWSSLGNATLGHSFWLIVIADGLFILNVAILVLLEQKRRRRLQTMGGLIGGQVTGAGGNTPQNIYSGGGMGGGSLGARCSWKFVAIFFMLLSVILVSALMLLFKTIVEIYQLSAIVKPKICIVFVNYIMKY